MSDDAPDMPDLGPQMEAMLGVCTTMRAMYVNFLAVGFTVDQSMDLVSTYFVTMVQHFINAQPSA